MKKQTFYGPPGNAHAAEHFKKLFALTSSTGLGHTAPKKRQFVTDK